MLGMMKYEEHKYMINDKVIILDNESGDRFDIGEVVSITVLLNDTDGSAYYRCENEDGVNWYVMQSSMKSVLPTNQLPDNLFEV